MKRLYSILLAFCLAISASAETVFTFSSGWDDLYQEKDDILVYLLQGENTGNSPYFDAYAPKGPETRLYPKNTIWIGCDAGLTNIQIVFAKPDDKTYIVELNPSDGTVISGGTSSGRDNPVVDKWTGNATEVTFTLGETGQRIIKRIVVNGDPVNPDDDKPKDPEPLPTEEDLIDSYVYAEPTAVSPKDTVISKKEYAFIDNNILVHCSQGSILKESTDPEDLHPAYFNCNADYQLTFTATENIKGIEIDGFVRKAFNATCEPETATIEYLTDSDYDMEGWPALVIRNINAKSVTLTCPKQLRCYAVRLFFQENPDPLYTGIGSMPDSEISIQKILREGRLLIIRGEKIYSAQGMEEK